MPLLLNDFRHDAGAHGLAALADGKAQPLLHRDGGDQRHHHLHVIPRHHHLGALGQLHRPGHIGGAEVKLRPVVVKEGGMSAALLLTEPVHTVFCVGRSPTISISSPTLTTPRSTLPVTTVPLPEIENTSSTGIRNGLSIPLFGVGIYESSASASFMIDLV